MRDEEIDDLIFSVLTPTDNGKSSATPDPVDWITENFYIPEMVGKKDKPTIELYSYQRACIREALRRDDEGRFIYDLVLWSDLKKSAKSSIAAAVIVYRAWHSQFGSFKVVGNDLKQADSRVFAYAKRAIELNPTLRAKANLKMYKAVLPNDTFIEAIPVDPAGEAGGGDDMIEFTELHASNSKAHKRMWAEMTLSPLKLGYSQRWIDTYAGYSGESEILEPLYDQLVRPENRFQIADPDAPDDLETYRFGRTFCLWNTKPRLPWQTLEYYKSEKIVLLPQDYDRMHRNMWTISASAFVPKEWWHACKVDKLPDLDRFREVVVALDAAVDDDCFGLLVLSRHGEKHAVRFAQKWIPPPHGKIDFDEVEKVVRWCVGFWNVLEICYDPYQLHDFCTRLANENLAKMYEFTQGAPRAVSDKALRDRIRDRLIMWDDQTTGVTDLKEHIENANAKSDPLDPKSLRIIKRSPEKKIDLTICASMGSNRAEVVLSP